MSTERKYTLFSRKPYRRSLKLFSIEQLLVFNLWLRPWWLKPKDTSLEPSYRYDQQAIIGYPNTPTSDDPLNDLKEKHSIHLEEENGITNLKSAKLDHQKTR